MGFTLFERWSPEYALNNAFEDMRESGLDGLKKHLTANALKSVKNLETISNITDAMMISKAVMGDSAINVLLDKLSECDWTIKDVMKGSETSKAIVGFNYQDEMTGTIEMKMIKEDSIWKIDSLAMPKFDKITLPEIETKPSEEA